MKISVEVLPMLNCVVLDRFSPDEVLIARGDDHRQNTIVSRDDVARVITSWRDGRDPDDPTFGKLWTIGEVA